MMPRFFKTAAAFHVWLATHHATKTELVVGFFKKGTGKPGITLELFHTPDVDIAPDAARLSRAEANRVPSWLPLA